MRWRTESLFSGGWSKVVDQASLQDLRRRFDAMPEPPERDGYIGEKASLTTTFHLETPAPTPQRGRHG